MTPQPQPRGIWMDHQTHLALVEYAWIKRTTMSEVFRAVLEEIASGHIDDSVLAVTDRPGRKRLNVKATDEVWEAATKTASQAGVGFHSLVRRHIIKAVTEEGLLE